MAQIQKAPEKVSVRLFCTLSGNGRVWLKGETVQVDPIEADRLICLGAAEIVENK